MSLGMVWVYLLSEDLMRVFTTDDEVIAIGSQYLIIATLIFNAYVILNISISALQGMKKPMFAIWIGIYRQLVMPPLVFWALTEVAGYGLVSIWWGIAGITWSAAIIAFLFTMKKLKSLVK